MRRTLIWIVTAAALALPAGAAANPFSSLSPATMRGFRTQDTSNWLSFGKNRKSEAARAEREKAAKVAGAAGATGAAGAGSGAEAATTKDGAPCDCPCPDQER